MCGIAGIYYLNEEARSNSDLLVRMCDAMIHRGPDDEGQYSYKHMAIGMRRLSIIGVENGHQPIPNEDKSIWVVLNGEIYNHQELKELLLKKGHVYRTSTDTECIVHLYEEYGEHCVDYLRGMFAFAVLDQRDGSLFIARDRLGIKPLFYAITKDKVLFGSELKALLEDAAVPRDMDLAALDAYMTYGYIPAPLTIYQSMRKLEPGHTMRLTRKGAKIEQYWDVPRAPDLKRTEEDFCEEFITIFEETVRLHLMSEVPLGAFLSGGVDSGLVVAFMARHNGSPVRAFTVGFGGTTGDYLDERPYARLVARRYRAQHYESEIHPNVRDVLGSVVRAFDEPFADDSVIPTFYICQEARRRVKVVLTGAGGDELFGGYERYFGLLLSQAYEAVPRPVRRLLIEPLSELLPARTRSMEQFRRFVRSAGRGCAERYQSYLSSLDSPARINLYSDEFRQQMPFANTEALGTRFFDLARAGSVVDRALFQDLKMYLPDDILALSDRLSMLHSLELRVPFLDHKVVELCSRIPAQMKMRMGRKKYLLKKVAHRFLDREVLEHRKQGFCAPMASWLRNELKDYCLEALSETKLMRHGLFDPCYVSKLINEHMSWTRSHEKLLFRLMMFQLWYEGQS